MGGAVYATELKKNAPTALEVSAGGAIPVTQEVHTVTDNGGPGMAADNLDTITKINTDDGDELLLRLTNGASDITIRSGQDNIFCPAGQNMILSRTSDYVRLRYDAQITAWNVIAYNLALPWNTVVGGSAVSAGPWPIFIQYNRIAHGDLTATGSTQDVLLEPALPAGAEVIDVVMDIHTRWGSATASVCQSVRVAFGTTGGVNLARANAILFNIFTAAVTGRGARGTRGVGANWDAATVNAHFVAIASLPADLSNVDAGVMDIYTMYTILPNVA